MIVRPASDADLAPIQQLLVRYAQIYAQNASEVINWQSLIDGRAQNIEDAAWLYYEGTSAWFPKEMLEQCLPWLVMQALVQNDDCRWVVLDDDVIALEHPLFKPYVTADSLRDGTHLASGTENLDMDSGECALESYAELRQQFAWKRIHGAKRLH